MMEPLHLFSVFHLNLAYSAIAESQRAEVIERCYWPILRMASDRCPIGVEASGYTLETIARLDPGWIEEFRGQLNAGRCELVGSGYAQVIGPLVPWRVNAANLRIGLETYESLLETRPVIGLIGEQAYSSGLASQYGQAGYQALIMEWENPASAHPEWKSEWRYRPQMARDSRGESIPILWSSAIAFQKFQRYAHGELSLDSLVGYLRDQAGPGRPLFCIYANDAEVFDFRPGRYETEPALAEEGEWVRISRLLDRLSTLDAFRFCCPSEGLEYLRRDAEPLCLESAEDPVPVKKQRKYNVTRWAVTGRDDLGINTACWRIYRSLVERGSEEE
ncbi:MAG: glycoside hydrolase family 57, partial [Myxococcota bacterium]